MIGCFNFKRVLRIARSTVYVYVTRAVQSAGSIARTTSRVCGDSIVLFVTLLVDQQRTYVRTVWPKKTSIKKDLLQHHLNFHYSRAALSFVYSPRNVLQQLPHCRHLERGRHSPQI